MKTKSLRTNRIRVNRALLAMLSAAGFLAGCGSVGKAAADDPVNAPHVAVAKVTRGDLSSTLNIASEFLPYQEVTVYAKVSGYIQKLDVNWGTHVRQGQLLAVLDIPELQQQLQLDEASVRRSEQDVLREREELNRAESIHTVAHLTYTRLADVQKTRPELVAQQEIDVAQGKDLETSASVSSAKDALAESEQALVAAKASLEKDRAMFAYSRITAPFDGVVTEIDAYTGALLPAGTSSNKGDQALCHLAEDRLLRLVIPVPESAVPDIRSGSSVQVRVPVLSKVFQGTVARVSDQVDLATRTMHAEIDVPNSNLEIVPGMYAEASLVLKEKHGALSVPVQAIDRQEEGATVFMVDRNNRIQQRQVQLGIESPNQVEVVSGLDENDLVVVGNRSQLRTGSTIQPKLVSNGLTGGGM
ncbi:MAG: efflux RND transporter periplasmic adaptor subunit [Acidobacteriia bacterium]|nr:efflux RND transporter periplasmic adaptor subunit [Terriglobia bacterium]